MAETSKITIERGNPYWAEVQILDVDGNPFDLTGHTLFFTVKDIDDFTDTDNLALITQDVTEHTDPTNGITEIELDVNQTLVPSVGFYKWDYRIYRAAESAEHNPVQFNTIPGACEVTDVVTKRTS